jgi:hypothetical protein
MEMVGAPCLSRGELDFSPAEKSSIFKERALQAAEKLIAVKRSEGYGLQPVRKGQNIDGLAPEGIVSLS